MWQHHFVLPNIRCLVIFPRLIQYVVIRHDIAKDMQWPLGAVIAQACHATTAALEIFKDDPDTKEYLSDVENMHKVVLEVPDEAGLMKAVKILEEHSIKHKLWIEQPENLPTCVALKPYTKEQIKPYDSEIALLTGSKK